MYKDGLHGSQFFFLKTLGSSFLPESGSLYIKLEILTIYGSIGPCFDTTFFGVLSLNL